MSGASEGLSVGSAAPALVGLDADGASFDLASLRGQRVIVYFYPKDDTPGCTAQACELRDHMGSLEASGVRVVGVSPDKVSSHARFRDKHGLNFTLVADPAQEIVQAWGVWREKKSYGRTYMGVVRSTFVVGAGGEIEAIYDNVKVKGHLETLRQGGWV